MKISKISKLNEDALKTNLDTPVDDTLRGTVPPTYIKAIQDHKERTALKNKVMKDREEKAKELDKREPIKRNAGSKQMKLEEAADKLNKAEKARQKELDKEYYTTLQDLIYMELFGEHLYTPSLKLPGSNYNNEDEVVDFGVTEKVRNEYGIPKEDNIIGVEAKGKTKEARAKHLERIAKLAEILDLDYVVIGDNEKGVIYFDDYTAEANGPDYLRELGINPVEDNKRLKKLVNKLDWDFIETLDELKYALNYERRHNNAFTETEIKYILDNLKMFAKGALAK